ncbi:hypothetical protein DL96DRAFT_638690 [Flagelloscypha sp. PMI_526]|nr:hypothetical protein DL96DRAFT_638690 [Flagelloscypha sp. PMI_526]
MSLSTSLSLLVLPQEILDKIVGYLASSPTSLVSCALTCTVLLPLSREHLYKDIHPTHNSSSVHLCLRTLKTSPFLASRVRALRSGIHESFEVAPFLPELRKVAFSAHLDRHAPRKWSKLKQEEAISGLFEKSLGRVQESCVALTVPPSDAFNSLNISSASHLNLDFSTVGVWNLDSSRFKPSSEKERPTPRSLFVSGMPSVRDTSLVGETLTDPSFIADLTKLKAIGWVKPQAASFETVLQSSLMSSLEIIRIDIGKSLLHCRIAVFFIP